MSGDFLNIKNEHDHCRQFQMSVADVQICHISMTIPMLFAVLTRFAQFVLLEVRSMATF